MTRVIKFRAWDEQDGKMVYDFVEARGNKPSPYLNSEGALVRSTWYHLMQFTGFTQKGVEIYEGDILESDREWWRVDWDKDGGQWYCSGLFDGEDFALAEIVGDKDMTVEGNLYENPELLAV